MIDNEPEKFRLSLYVSILQKYGVFGSERIKLLKDCFKTIIDEIFPIDSKFYVALNNEIPFKEVIKIERDKIKHNRKSYKFCKETTEKSVLDILKQFDFTSTILDYFEKYGEEIYNRFNILKQYIHELIILRNKIFSLLKVIDDFNFESQIFNFANLKDHSNYCKLLVHLKGTKYVDPFHLWEIPKKTTGDDEYIENQLEFDEE